jgi:hypothetical protein
MALFDTNSGLGGLLGDLGDYGFGVPRNTGGLVADAEREAINKRALLSGLISAGLTYAATPKNLNAGSIVPYLGKAGLSGFGASQNVVDQALNSAYRNKLLAGRDSEFSSINPLDVTPESLKAYQDSIAQGKKDPSLLRRAIPVEKPEGFTDTYKNVAIELFGTANPSQLTEQQRKQLGEEIKARAIANKPETKIVMPAGQTKYEETLGKIRAEQDVELVNTAKKSENNISKIDMTLNQIQKSDAITGFGADIQKNVNRFKAKVLNDAKAGKQVADTEILDAFLGSDVFPQIGALGIGAKGLDTPAEREFLRQVMTGTISMDKNALIRMTQIRRDIEKRAIDRYNQSLQSGELDDYFKSTKREKKLINIPDSSGFRIVP